MVMNNLESSWFLVLLNGVPSGFFQSSRGQGLEPNFVHFGSGIVEQGIEIDVGGRSHGCLLIAKKCPTFEPSLFRG